MKTIITICFLLLGSSAFAMSSQSDDSLTVTASGYASICIGFCHPSEVEVGVSDTELTAKKRTGRSANKQCQDEGYQSALLIEYKCDTDTEASNSGNELIVTRCDGRFLCDGEINTCH